MQFLTFMLNDQECAFKIASVLEIREYQRAHAVAGLPEFISGIINLRGSIIPLVDVRRKLGLPSVAATPYTAIAILASHGRPVGAVVDRVCEVVGVRADQIANSLRFGDGLDYVLGVISLEDRLIVAIDFDRLLGQSELRFVDLSSQTAPSSASEAC